MGKRGNTEGSCRGLSGGGERGKMLGKRYIGDGVYVEENEWGQLRITTWDGERDTNEIYFEPELAKEFKRYLEEYLERK